MRLSTPALMILCASGLFHFSCGDVGPNASFPLRSGLWRMELDLGEGQLLPFLFDLRRDSVWRMTIHNGDESIAVADIDLLGDSLVIRMPLYDSEFTGRVKNDSLIIGQWINHLKGPDYRIPFVARAGRSDRFAVGSAPVADVTGNWEVHFSPGSSEDAYDALGIFRSSGGSASGTFGTETGDYRFLDGRVNGDSLLLSCFDGSHAFLFKARVHGDSMTGRYWSGIHWQEPWVAVRNPSFKLRNQDSLTFLKEGHEMVDFRFPSLDGDSISPRDPQHAGRVMMVQIMGSWCPNCVDETQLLEEMYDKYQDSGLSVIAVAFEKYNDPTRALEQLRKFRDRLGVTYDIVYAGPANKEAASERLPFLEHIMSYPTCIFIDRKGMVRRIRTGFYGPGTGAHYVNYKRNLESFLEELLAEKP
jgi:thiol-disulfide isomerase/thioredoxin